MSASTVSRRADGSYDSKKEHLRALTT